MDTVKSQSAHVDDSSAVSQGVPCGSASRRGPTGLYLGDEFDAYLLSECGYSELTAKQYRSKLRAVDAWLRSQGTELHSARVDELRAYLRHYSRSHESCTVSNCRSAIVTYGRFLGFKWHEEIDTPKIPKKLPEVPSPEEIERLINAAAGHPRNLAMFEMFYATGCRSDELRSMKVKDVDLDGRQVRVIGKGDKERIVFLGKAAVEAVRRYLGTVSRCPDDKLFQISTSALAYCLRRYAKKTNQRFDITPHTFRHCFATHMLRSGKANLRQIQHLMGHESLEATAVYLHLDYRHLKAQHAHHPRERMALGLPAERPIAEFV